RGRCRARHRTRRGAHQEGRGALRMSSKDDERLSLAFIWDVTSPRFSRRGFMKTMAFASAAGFVAACGGGSGGGTKQSAAKVLNFYNWTDYVDPDHTIPDFQEQTGIKVTYDTYSSND